MAGASIAATTAKLHIEEIRTKKFGIGNTEPNPSMEDLHHAVTDLSAELHTKDVDFLMELIQNAEDNEYPQGVQPTLEFLLTTRDITRTGAPSTLLVFNNEVGFSMKNVESICSVGKSTKKGKRKLGFIGEKGIGFKSVFLVSTHPRIFSDGYQIKFSEAPNQDCNIGYVVPEWVEEKDIVSDVCYLYGTNKRLPTTTIILPLKADKVEVVKTQLSKLHPELLLFLSKIKRLSVRAISDDPKEVKNVSAIFISGETNRIDLPSCRATLSVVHLSAKEKPGAIEETCQYFLWRQAFQVDPESKVSARNDVEDWIILLAFPFGERLKRGTPSIGIYAFLPTAMVTNFPFIIQADFILASSREAILLDNRWNVGILVCVPHAFWVAFFFCVKNGFPLSSRTQAFKFLPAQTSSITELNYVRESIKLMVQEAHIMPCEMFCGKQIYHKPGKTIRIKRKFRELLNDVQKEGLSLEGMFKLKKVPVHSSLELESYSKVLDFLDMASYRTSDKWYVQCIQTCNFILQASEDVYVKLLCFIADMNHTSLSSNLTNLSFMKYVTVEGEVELHTPSCSKKILYAIADNCHTWLTKWNKLFGCQSDMFFLPSSTQKAIIGHERSVFLRSWLSSYANCSCCSVYEYALKVFKVLTSIDDAKLAIAFAHFVYQSYSKGFIRESELRYLCKIMPIVDGSGSLRRQRLVTLVPASRSKWATLFGPKNPFWNQYYIDIGEVYAKRYQFIGEHTPENELLDFLIKHSGAKDLPELCPPDMVLPLGSLTSQQAFLLLDWIRFLSKSILLDITGKSVFEMMKPVHGDFFVLDQEFYTDRLLSYVDELKYLGVRFGFYYFQRLLANHFMSLAKRGLSKEYAYLLLKFITISREKKMLYEEWLKAIKESKWLQTSQGFSAPEESLFLQSETEVEVVLRITNLPVVDESFYGTKLSTFSSELTMLGVMLNIERVYDLIAKHLAFPAGGTFITGNCGLLILRFIRYMGSSASGFIDKVTEKPWLKTNSGFECPLKCVLHNKEWDSLFNIVDVPIIDEGFYGSEIRSFLAEMKAIGVAVDFDSAFKLIIVQFKLLSSSQSLTPANIVSLLSCIREMIQTRPLQLSEIHSSLLGEMWLKTRHGYRAPNESILFSSKWATVSLFSDLPFIDDSFYNMGIHEFKNELKLLGVVIDFTEGAIFVARRLKQPISSGLITRDSAISLLECIKCLMSGCSDQNAYFGFINNLKKSKWLKTIFGFTNPGQCILFDPAWDGILQRRDVPSLDERYYNTDLSVFKNQLRALGVKVDPADVCSLLPRILWSKTETPCITRMYNFLCKFYLNHESTGNSYSQVWIHSRNGAGGGEWISSHLCVLYDKFQLFGSRLYVLENYYSKELLPMFTSIFGVPKFPSTDEYMQLWNDWGSRSNSQVTAMECFSFFSFVLDNWNLCTLETLKKKLTKVPATTSTGEEIYLVSREDVFLPDDLQLKRLFDQAGVPLFTWLPRQSGLSSVSPWRLYEVYSSIGVRKISESVEYKVDRSLILDYQSKMFVDSRNGVFKNLLKIILAFQAGPMMKMPAKERHNAAKSLLELSVFETDNAIQVDYRLLLWHSNRTLEAQSNMMVFWDRISHRLIMDRSCFEDGKTNIEFVSCFAKEIAEGVLSQEQADAVYKLSKLLQIGFMYEFKEDAVNFLLIEENLELFVEDTEFLNTKFGKRTHARSELGPLTLIPCSKKQCQ
ncbi:hypothetical protein CCACVL1_30167 [Corchorus capsularis]|uniref:Sacsin/Nov domain-containing protein n=1 Tax=Corchorus capsularis TaxID=210143 RepID=A0A1R3FYI7_COCAP|nr:hypothetical protein CCACVL1_30167 [Corchorus capsularis]